MIDGENQAARGGSREGGRSMHDRASQGGGETVHVERFNGDNGVGFGIWL